MKRRVTGASLENSTHSDPPFTQEPVLIMGTPRRPSSLELDPRLRRPRSRVVSNRIGNSGSGQEVVEIITINTDGEENNE
jgi:hypothetical protein